MIRANLVFFRGSGRGGWRGGRVVTALPRLPSWLGGGLLCCPSSKTTPPHRPFGPRHRCAPQLWNPGYATAIMTWHSIYILACEQGMSVLCCSV